jgi:hypothetical protein
MRGTQKVEKDGETSHSVLSIPTHSIVHTYSVITLYLHRSAHGHPQLKKLLEFSITTRYLGSSIFIFDIKMAIYGTAGN